MNTDHKTDPESRPDRTGETPTPQPGPVGNRRKRNRWTLISLIGLLAAAGIVSAVLVEKGRVGGPGTAGRPVPAPVSEGTLPSVQGEPAQPAPGETVVRISPNEIENAQIKIEPAMSGASAGLAGPGPAGAELRTTGIVSSNAYRETPVFPVAGGIVRQVNVQLGDKVRNGQPLVTIFSTDLANTEAEYLKMLAEYEQHEQAHHRTIELVKIGAVSQEELEQSEAAVKSMLASIASLRRQLFQLGLDDREINELKSPEEVNSVISVPAPASGTVISRSVNNGEVLAQGKELLRVANLSVVWVVAQLSEKDFSMAQLGVPAVITAPAYPDKVFRGHITYVDPRVDSQTRTAQVRIDVPNPAELLKLGMFVDVSLGTAMTHHDAGSAEITVPKSAIQIIGTSTVVYVATVDPGVFIQRQVRVGQETNGQVSIYGGIKPGERVVTAGSFLLRAESLKQNAQPANPSTLH
ncbi:MAG TPA: efflux RND transporter periplasmic adaptor subunit [Blastocatellia bacterium]|nr:efflux RND transporter periplasmic adaptor subunit [Blastocatellia bacterium]